MAQKRPGNYSFDSSRLGSLGQILAQQRAEERRKAEGCANVGCLMVVLGALGCVFFLAWIIYWLVPAHPHVNLTNADIAATVTALPDSDIIATAVASDGHDDPIYCNGVKMFPGSYCVETTAGGAPTSATPRTYEDVVARDRAHTESDMRAYRDAQNDPIGSAIGAAPVLIVGVLVLTVGIVMVRKYGWPSAQIKKVIS